MIDAVGGVGEGRVWRMMQKLANGGDIVFAARVGQQSVVSGESVAGPQTSISACGEEGAGLARKRKAKPASEKQEPAEETHAAAA
jgi:hypothetical protein